MVYYAQKLLFSLKSTVAVSPIENVKGNYMIIRSGKVLLAQRKAVNNSAFHITEKKFLKSYLSVTVIHDRTLHT